MLVIPSIDIKDGKVVRIFKGDPSKEIISLSSPYDVAVRWREKGARYFHIVDLSAVFSERKQNHFELIKKIISLGVPSSVGGGIRSIEDAKKYIDAGADSVVVSTMIEENPEEFVALAEKFTRKVLLALDFDEEFRFSLRGWREKSKKIFEIMEEVADLPLRGFLFTAVFRDGTSKGIPREHFREISKLKGKLKEFVFIASGGVSMKEDLLFLKELGFWGAVVGRAFYEGKINVFEV